LQRFKDAPGDQNVLASKDEKIPTIDLGRSGWCTAVVRDLVNLHLG